MTLEDLSIPIAKLRAVADIIDIDRCRDEGGVAVLDEQVCIGAHCILLDSALEIEKVIRQEFHGWRQERKEFQDTIAKLNQRITELRGGVSHD